MSPGKRPTKEGRLSSLRRAARINGSTNTHRTQPVYGLPARYPLCGSAAEPGPKPVRVLPIALDLQAIALVNAVPPAVGCHHYLSAGDQRRADRGDLPGTQYRIPWGRDPEHGPDPPPVADRRERLCSAEESRRCRLYLADLPQLNLA